MQDLQSSFAAVERRLRPLDHHHPQLLKCPRCESTNTKFCYYNNYNLSQPRHFCKSCRRYWTKGGVLRNVPVGGGCRKNKRSKAKPPPPELPIAASSEAPAKVQKSADSERKSSSHSSSETSGLIAAAATPLSGAGLTNIHEYEPAPANPSPGGASLHALLGRAAGAGDGLTAASSEPVGCGLGFCGVSLNQPGHDTCRHPQWQSRDHEGLTAVGGLFDQTVQMDLSWMGGGGFGPSDWQMKDHQGVYDLPTAVDQAYWSQSQWTDRDQVFRPSPTAGWKCQKGEFGVPMGENGRGKCQKKEVVGIWHQTKQKERKIRTAPQASAPRSGERSAEHVPLSAQ